MSKTSKPSFEDLAYSRLLPYVKLQYPQYDIAKHHRVIAHYLQKVESGEITRLAIFQPPRSGKTMLAGNFFASWFLGRNPEKEIIYASYSQDRSDDVGRDIRNLMQSEVHEKVFPNGCLSSDAKAARKFATVKGGRFYGVGWGGPLTGRGADCCLKGTLIETEYGPIRIEDLHESRNPPKVLSVDAFGHLCYAEIECSRKIEKKPVFAFETINGRVLCATGDHYIYSQFRGYTKLEKLQHGESLVTIPSGCSTQTETDTIYYQPQLYSKEETVYDLQIQYTKNFFANEILVHNCLILDDLIRDRVDSQSEINRRKREEWFTSTAYTRLMPGNSAIILIMTRWDYRDIASFLLRDLVHENWTVIKCPAIAEEGDLLKRKVGEALWPDRFPVERMARTKQTLTAEDWNALYQQNPVPKEGSMIQLSWFENRRYNMAQVSDFKRLLINNQDIPESMKYFKRLVISVDTAYKVSQLNDPTAITVWGSNGSNHYLINSIVKKVEFPELVQLIRRVHKDYAEWSLGPVPVLIEDKASGQSLIQQLKRMTKIPIIATPSNDTKVIRMEDSSVHMEAGNIWLPERAPWLANFELELSQFPMGLHDDQCDSMSQYINWTYKKHFKKTSKRRYRR